MLVSDFVIDYLKSRQDFEKLELAILQGGIVRQFYREVEDTKNIDIDITLFYKTRTDYIPQGIVKKQNDNDAEMYKGGFVDCRALFLDEMSPPKRWKERVRYIWQNETVFAYGNKELFDRFISETKMSELEQKELIAFYTIHIQTKGIWHEDKNFMKEMQLDKIQLRKTYWEDRGYPLYGKIMKMRAFEYIEGYVFALNRQFMPSPKCRELFLERLEWQPEHLHKMLISFANHLDDLFDLMNIVTKECEDKARQENLLVDDVYKYTFKTEIDCIRKENLL